MAFVGGSYGGGVPVVVISDATFSGGALMDNAFGG